MGSHKMETSFKNTGKRRRGRRRKAKSKVSEAVFEDSKSPSGNLGVTNVVIKKKNSEKVKKVTKQHLDSFLKGFRERQIAFADNQEKDCGECDQTVNKVNLFDQTVDLCDDDSLVENSNSNLVTLPPFEGGSTDEAVIDLSKDLADEVVDLTEPTGMSRSDCSAACIFEPIVIDISEDETKDKPNIKAENDEIFVIGTFCKASRVNNKHDAIIKLSDNWNNYNNIINSSDKLRKKYLKKQSILDKINKKNLSESRKECERPNKSSGSSKVAKIGENVYVNSPVALPSYGLRPIIIDGSNVAFVHSNSNFSCKRLEICINYFKEKGHKVTAFVPQYRLSSHRNDNPQLLRKLERQGDVILTPSKKIDGRTIVPYDDRFIVQTAVLKGGIIVTRDNYNDLLKENPAWAETIKYRTLAFTWVDDVLMFPNDPLGEYGPSLEEFLRFH